MIRFGTLDWGIEEKKAIEDLVSPENPQLSMGKKVYEFERKFAEWLGTDYAVMVNSGTSALITAIKTMQTHNMINELHTTALTYTADWNALDVCNVPYIPHDVGNDFVVHANLNDVEDFYSDWLSVDLLGKPCRIGNDIDDASEALGSELKGTKMGANALIGTFSFYVAHQITTIEGGMVVTDDKTLYETMLSIRDNGRICTCSPCTLKTTGICQKRSRSQAIERRWETKTQGYNFKPTEFQGALGLVKMTKIDKICQRRHEIFKWYEAELGDLKEESDEYIVPLAYPVKVDHAPTALEIMEKQDIECRGMFPAYSSVYNNAYRISQEYILIPSHQDLSDEDIQSIIENVNQCR